MVHQTTLQNILGPKSYDEHIYNDEGQIRPLSGDVKNVTHSVKISPRVIVEEEPIPQRSDG